MPKPVKDAKYGHAITSRLKPDERARIEKIAEREQRPLGNMFRLLALKGADEYEQSLQPADPALSATTA